jgi:MFS superfamily sulfate permease-like transporter
MADVIIFCAITTLYSHAVSPHDQGKVMGLCFIIVSAVWVLTGLLNGLLAGININLPILLTPLAIILVVIMLPKYLPNSES